MPKRVLDGDAMWASTKLSELPEWMIPEYAWFYPLADANGGFEITNLRIIWGKIAAIRPNLALENVQEIIRAFGEHGLLFTWEQDGKRYAHWTGSEKPGRLPRPSRRTARYGPVLAPPVPAQLLREYQLRQQNRRSATEKASPVLVLGLEGLRRKEEEAPPAAPATPRNDAAWRAIGTDLPIGSQQFQSLWESFSSARKDEPLSQVMERTIQAWQGRGEKIPPPFIEAKRRVEAQEEGSTPSMQKGKADGSHGSRKLSGADLDSEILRVAATAGRLNAADYTETPDPEFAADVRFAIAESERTGAVADDILRALRERKKTELLTNCSPDDIRGAERGAR